jgi:hypothetical protein
MEQRWVNKSSVGLATMSSVRGGGGGGTNERVTGSGAEAASDHWHLDDDLLRWVGLIMLIL